MLKSLCKKSCPNKASGRVVDGKLILSLPAANDPVVWQMDLAQAKPSALEVRHNAETGLHALALKTPKGEHLEVAVFSDRARAVEGLMAASKALENAQGQIRPDGGAALGEHSGAVMPYAAASPKKGGFFKTAFLAIVGLFVLFIILSALSPLTSTNNSGDAPEGGANPSQTGVPLSADQYLQQR